MAEGRAPGRSVHGNRVVKSLRALLYRFLALGRRRRANLDRDLEDEVRAHLEMAEEDAMASGATRDEARREARRMFGSRTLVIEEHRRQRSAACIETLARDVRHAIRMLVVQPAWTAAALACLAIATGANTAAFSVVNAVFLRPLPFPEPDELAMIALKPRESGEPRPFTLRQFRDLGTAAEDQTDLAAYTFLSVSMDAGRGAEVVEAQLVSGGYFDVLRVAPLVGRFFDRDADRTNSPPQAVISERLWRQSFGGDPSVVGRTIRINRRPMLVAGVAPPGFVGVMGLIASDLWLPTSLYASLADQPEAVPAFGVVGRRSRGMTNAQTQLTLSAMMNASARALSETTPLQVIVDPAAGFGVPPVLRRRMPEVIAVVAALAALLVIVAAANVASLVLARGTLRVREMGLRLALGASRSLVARQLLTESLVLAALGSALGMAVAYWVTRLLQPSASPLDYVSYTVDITPDLRVFAYAVAGAVATAAVFGVVPAYRAARTDLLTVLKPAGGAGQAPAAARSLRVMVASQIAVSTVLLVASGLLARSYLKARAVNPGFDTHNLLSVSLDLHQAGMTALEDERQFTSILLDRVLALPGVDRAGLTREAPLANSGPDVGLWIADGGPSGRAAVAESFVVSPEYFAVLGIRLVQGRLLTRADIVGSHRVVINETMAHRVWPSDSPLGRSFRLVDASGEQLDVIGVVKDIEKTGAADAPRAAFYEPLGRSSIGAVTLVVRSRLAPNALEAAVRRQIASISPDLPPMQVGMLDNQLERARAPRRQTAFYLALVGGIGLTLAAIGLYGVTSFTVRSRVREFGIRLALGATAASVRSHVLFNGLRTVTAGLIVGIALSIVAARLFASFLFGVVPSDPLTIAVVALSLVGVAAVALYLPARWATGIEPARALRNE